MGAGVNAKLALANRMQAAIRPDTFQVHGGAELARDLGQADDLTQPLTDLYEAEGLADMFPAGIIELVSDEGVPYSVPVNVHRNGVLWYNKAIFDGHGLDARPRRGTSSSPSADALKAAGVTPLALGDKDGWTALNLFEQILLGQLGRRGLPGHLGRRGALDRRARHRRARDLWSRARLRERGPLHAHLGPGRRSSCRRRPRP